MFFWMFLASFMGIIMFGQYLENTKSEEVFVAPIYEAFALNMLQQHTAAYYGYQDLQNADYDVFDDYINNFPTGIIPLITVEEGGMTDGGTTLTNKIFPYISARIPMTYNPQNGTRTYLYCIDKAQTNTTYCDGRNGEEVVRYIITIRMIPPRYDGASKLSVLQALANVVEGSSSVGLLQDAGTPLVDSGTTEHQPLGARYFVLSSGDSATDSPYIPNYILCNTPLSNSGDSVLGDEAASNSFLVTLSLIQGLSHSENLTVGSLASGCPALQ